MREKVAVVIPTHYNRMDSYQRISIRQCLRVLRGYPVIIASHQKLDRTDYLEEIEAAGLSGKVSFTCFPEEHFKSIHGYNRLLLTPYFYKRFSQFENIFIHQLDCYVFRDELQEWCARGYDFIGAPWLEGYEFATPDANVIGVGNGGLSLRNVAQHLKVLRSFSYLRRPGFLFNHYYRKLNWKGRLRHSLTILANMTYLNNTFSLFNNFPGGEDIFWGLYANRNFDWFRVAPVEEAIKFCFEAHPRRFYKETGCLPFACHAWEKFDLDFWRPFFERDGHEVPEKAN